MILTYLLYLVLCIGISISINEATLELETSGVLYVCLGGTLSVKCSTGADTLRWTVDSLQPPMVLRRGVTKRGTAEMATPISTTLTTLYVSRSLNGSSSLPLMSTLSTNNATADLNGTTITCSAETAGQSLANASLLIALIGNSSININITPNLSISEFFQSNGIIITLEWTTVNGVVYTVHVDPEVSVAVNYTCTVRNSAQLLISYDKEYNVGVTSSLCGRNSTTFYILNYLTCPQVQIDLDDLIMVVKHRNPAMQGTTVSFSCPPGLLLIGSNASTCMGNGEWEPDIKGTRCKADCGIPIVGSNVSLNYSSTLEDSLLIFKCNGGLLPNDVFTARCYRNKTWIPNPFNHVCTTSLAVNCGVPSPPSDGYLEPYTSTIEGVRVNRVNVCQNGQLAVEEITCNPDGQWELVNGSACPDTESDSKSTLNLLPIISGSLGSFVLALLVCGIVVIAIIIGRKKDTAVSSLVGGYSTCGNPFPEDHSFEGESTNQNPEYEEIAALKKETTRCEQEELEILQNMAYGPLHSR